MIKNGTLVEINQNCSNKTIIGKHGVVTKFYEADPYIQEDYYEVIINGVTHSLPEYVLDEMKSNHQEGYKRVLQEINGKGYTCLVKESFDPFIATAKEIEEFNSYLKNCKGIETSDMRDSVHPTSTKQFKVDKGIVTSTKEDIIDHPKHYNFSDLEPITVIEKWDLPYHLGNVVKYIARSGKKDPRKEKEDLKKAAWYLNRYINNMRD